MLQYSNPRTDILELCAAVKAAFDFKTQHEGQMQAILAEVAKETHALEPWLRVNVFEFARLALSKPEFAAVGRELEAATRRHQELSNRLLAILDVRRRDPFPGDIPELCKAVIEASLTCGNGRIPWQAVAFIWTQLVLLPDASMKLHDADARLIEWLRQFGPGADWKIHFPDGFDDQDDPKEWPVITNALAREADKIVVDPLAGLDPFSGDAEEPVLFMLYKEQLRRPPHG